MLKHEYVGALVIGGVAIMFLRIARSRKPIKNPDQDDPDKKEPLPLPGESLGPYSLRNCKEERPCFNDLPKIIRSNPEFNKSLFITGATDVGTFSEYVSFLREWANAHPDTLIVLHYDKNIDWAGSIVSHREEPSSKIKKGSPKKENPLHKNFKELEEDLNAFFEYE